MAAMTAQDMLAEALVEDRLNGGYFDFDGFEAHYAEEDERERSKAWNMYLDIISEDQERACKHESRIRAAAENFSED